MKELTEKEKTKYLRSALGLSGVAVNDYMAEMIWRMYESLQEKGGDFNLRDASKIEAFMNEKFNIKQEQQEKQEVLDDLKATLPKHNTVLSVMLAYIDKFWANKTGRPSAEDVIKKKKINNKDLSFGNCFDAIAAMRTRYKGNSNWAADQESKESLTQFIENELSTSK